MVSQKEMEANLALITMAGSETSATALSAVTYYLCRNKGADAKLKKEIRSATQDERDITWDTIKDLPSFLRPSRKLFVSTPQRLLAFREGS
jgi:cytochrome P450